MIIKPKKIKFKKIQNKSKLKKITYQSCFSCYNEQNHSNKVFFFSKESGIFPADQLITATRLLQKKLNKKGSVQPLVFPQKPISRKPVGVRIGKGKGSVSFWVCKVKYGQPLFKVSLVSFSSILDINKSLSKRLSISVGYRIVKGLLFLKQLTQG